MSVDQEHINYEYVMLTETNKAWKSGQIHPFVFNNMCNIVVYKTAYSLLTYIIDNELVGFLPPEIESIYGKIHDQIIGLSEKRTAVQENKLQPDDCQKLIDYFMSIKGILNLP
jgi:hypothetical protein